MSKRCANCGREGEGRFCANCGQPLPGAGGPTRFCSSCGAASEADALYCAECGAPVAGRPQKTLSQRLPWILSALALVAFAVAISLMIGESTGERGEGMPPTGAVIPSPGQAGAGGAGPSGVDLSSMSPREAADRLFDRAMRTEAQGDTTQARFFAQMGVQAYGNVPDSQIDSDARFHIGLLQLMQGDVEAAERSAEAILARGPNHLLGWLLRVRVAEFRGDDAALAEARDAYLGALDAERATNRPEYEQHGSLIDAEAARLQSMP